MVAFIGESDITKPISDYGKMLKYRGKILVKRYIGRSLKGTPTSITASRFLMHGGNKNKRAHTHTHTDGLERGGPLRWMRALGFRRRSTRTSTLAASQRVHSTPPRQSHTVVRSAPRCCQQLCLALPTGSVSRIRHAAGTTEKNLSR